ncbi:hypothetical protein [Micromonospora sp. NPDC005652]|uniref:hypothetical protein n=1 Tax=Micromonospora sp. NPDC005652 TaxID=3157046 RepID=UPI0033EA3453
MRGNDSMMVPDGRRYSALAPDEVHHDMRIDPAATRRNMQRFPSVVEAHRNCSTCAELAPVREMVPSRLGRLRLTLADLVEAVGLPVGYRAVRMYVDQRTQVLHLVIEGEDLDPLPPDVEPPPVRL